MSRNDSKRFFIEAILVVKNLSKNLVLNFIFALTGSGAYGSSSKKSLFRLLLSGSGLKSFVKSASIAMTFACEIYVSKESSQLRETRNPVVLFSAVATWISHLVSLNDFTVNLQHMDWKICQSFVDPEK